MAKPPPVPPENKSPKDPDSASQIRTDGAKPQPPKNPKEQGQSGNIHQNTRNTGHQQDR
jgi:hypothetical protein